MIGFTKALAQELATRGITVNCIAPGFIQTKMTDVLTDQQKDLILKKIPMGRLGSTEDIANAAVFLASPYSNYITGQVLTVDGGMVM
jgi:3-oxoacyl-[acyl-carrier protein] reductase